MDGGLEGQQLKQFMLHTPFLNVTHFLDNHNNIFNRIISVCRVFAFFVLCKNQAQRNARVALRCNST